MKTYALIFVVLLCLVCLELAILKYRQPQRLPWREVIFNLNSGHILMWVFRGVEVAGYAWVYAHANLHWAGHLPVAGQWVLAFVAWDLSFYCMHRTHHKIPLLWAVHALHHQGEHYGLSLAIRNSWYSSLTSFLFTWPLAVMGLPLEMFVLVSTIHYGVQFYNHTGVIGKCGWLDKILVTPSNHRVHHGIAPQYIDRNFGGTLLIWDRLFATYQPELDDIPRRYGMKGRAVPGFNPLWANNPPLYWRLRERWARLFAGVALKVPDEVITTGGILQFLLVVLYVQLGEGWATSVQTLFVLWLALATVAMGALSDGRGWGRMAWAGLMIPCPLLALWLDGTQWSAWGLLLAGLSVLHGVWGYVRSRPEPVREAASAAP